METARRELVEEAGLKAGRWRELGSILSSPGVFAEVLHLYLAEDLIEVPDHREDYEVFEVHWMDFSEALRRALDGRLRDAKTLVALFRVADIRNVTGSTD
jgi:ADP-ribose pyrophosphatase